MSMQMTIWSMRIAWWIRNTKKHTLSICNTKKHTLSICNTKKHTLSICNTKKHTLSICNTQCFSTATTIAGSRLRVALCLRWLSC